MKLELISNFDNLPEVTTNKIFQNSKFHPDGLFSEQIFGPVKSYQCQCKVTTAQVGQKCPTCGVTITSSALRRKQYAKIKVGRFIHPVIWLLLSSNKSLKTISNSFLNFETYLTKDLKIKSIEKDVPTDGYMGLDAIYNFFKVMTQVNEKSKQKERKSKIASYIYKTIQDNTFFVDSIIVIPPDLRPIIANKRESIMDEINKLYVSLLDYKDKGKEIQTYYGRLRFEAEVQKLVENITTVTLGKMGSKSGILRSKIEGKRVDFSGRAVINVDPQLPITHCKVSRYILLELFKLDIAHVLLKKRQFITFKAALDYVQEQIDNEEIIPSTKEILDKLATNKLVILNRQPTLHKGSMISFRVIPTDSFTIGINPLVCPAFNADFDGDQMAIYRPLSQIANHEAKRLLSSKNFLDPSDAKLHFYPTQDIVYGIYKLSNTKKGRELIAEALNLETVPDHITSKVLNRLLEVQGRKDSKVFDRIKVLGLSYTHKFPTTMSIKDFVTTKVNLTGDKESDREKLSEKEKEIRKTFSFAGIINSGARASWTQAKQLLVARGYVSDFFGKIIPYPISKPFSDGLNPEQFFVSTYGTRKGLLDVAENTAESGYLTRRLVYSTTLCRLDPNLKDCGTKRTLPVHIEDEKHARSFIYRYYYLNDPLKNENEKIRNITSKNYKELVGKDIFVRSPITCSRYIGIIAAQSLGERSTQLVLRTFHTSGVAKSKNMKSQEDIISALSMVEKLVDKNITISSLQQISDINFKIYDIYKDYGDIQNVHFEVILSQRHKLDNGMLWRLSGKDVKNTKLYSLRQIPVIESWFLGIIFSNIRNVVNGLFSKTKKLSVLEKIAVGEI